MNEWYDNFTYKFLYMLFLILLILISATLISPFIINNPNIHSQSVPVIVDVLPVTGPIPTETNNQYIIISSSVINKDLNITQITLQDRKGNLFIKLANSNDIKNITVGNYVNI